jgi:DNA-binding CsgD family transcriptional regulator
VSGRLANVAARGPRIVAGTDLSRLPQGPPLASATLFGRSDELLLLAGAIDRLGDQGGALVLRGEAGIGKTTLLEAAVAHARASGVSVLRAHGVQSEASTPFASLQQLLQPLLGGLAQLPSPQRSALEAAFGMREHATPEVFLIGLATLELLSEASAGSPVLVVADDTQWLDHATASVLTFVARRVTLEPILLLAAARDGIAGPLDDAGLPELRVGPLAPADAARALDGQAPALDAVLRRRILDQAQGNPLALAELPLALADGGELATLAPEPPLTARLEHAFSARAAGLPAETRMLLLVAALDDLGFPGDIVNAAGQASGRETTLEAFAPAIAAGLIEVTQSELRFRHPLVRSAIMQAASGTETHAAHKALAEVLADAPDRRVWHLAAVVAGLDDRLAGELEQAAERADRKGAPDVAIAALHGAARRTTDPHAASERLLRAAELAFEIGRGDIVEQVMQADDLRAMTAFQAARVAFMREANDGIASEKADIPTLIEMADRLSASGELALALRFLRVASLRSYWKDPGAAVRLEVVAAAERVPVPGDDLQVLSIIASAAPVERGAGVIARVLAQTPDVGDPAAAKQIAEAACAVGAFDLADPFLVAAVDGLRAHGRLRLLAQVLMTQAFNVIYTGNYTLAVAAAEESSRLALETGQPIYQVAANAAESRALAVLGDSDRAEEIATAAEAVALQSGSSAPVAIITESLGIAALCAGRHAEAFAILRRLHDPADAAFHHVLRLWAVADLAEAAVRCGQRDAAVAITEELAAAAGQAPGQALQMGLVYARAVLADDAAAERLLQAALDLDLTAWPLYRARLQLAYGSWLRRNHRTAEARPLLRAARNACDAFGARLWASAAREELRAAGESSGVAARNVSDLLTPQELQITRMAAEGLTNKEIGERLYFSHRTIGACLYRAFPKLGISSRAELAAALGGSALDA